MSNSKQLGFVTLDLSALSKPAKKAKSSAISPYDGYQSPANQVMDSVGGSGMKPAKTMEERFKEALEKANAAAEKSLKRKIVNAVLRDRVRETLNAKYGGRVSPSDIRRFAEDGLRALPYDIVQNLEVPESLQHVVVASEDALPQDFEDDDKNL